MNNDEITLEYKGVDEIHPYANNPRKNDDAVDVVAESIDQCGYISPIVVDEDGIILAGHTRLKALKKEGYTKVPVIVCHGKTEEQKRKFRLLDNKTAEFSTWDTDLLVDELEGIDFNGIDFGFDFEEEEETDAGNFSGNGFTFHHQYGVTVILGSEKEQEECYNALTDMGYSCKVVTV